MASLDSFDIPPAVIEAYRLDQMPVDRPRTSTAELLRLDGVRAIVTGGGGDGLGNATCHRLAEQGARVAVLDISAEAAAASAREVAERWDTEALPVVADVGDREQVDAAVHTVAEAFGGLDLLVNNAGGSGSIGIEGRRVTQHGAFADMEVADLLSVVRVNLVGTLLMTRSALDVMVPAGAGRVVNVSSEGGKTGMPGLAVYNSCKSAVIGFTRNLAEEVGRQGIRVAAVCPGIMVTDRTLGRLAGGTGATFAALDAGFARASIGRCSIPDEVASVIAYLASDAGSYVHGTAVSVGGGIAD
jgi:NAD(P)-dependent dehydrogenase (short-subunit alcohol dehydrogenase family)